MRSAYANSLLVITMILAGCRSASLTDGRAMVRTELFFGLSIPEGGTISDAAWQGFVDDTITPRFPQGFTVIDGNGQWRESSGKIAHEHSKILLLFHERDRATIEKLDEIRAEYKKRFNQEAVIRESSDATVAF